MNKTKELIERVKELDAKATPGPWSRGRTLKTSITKRWSKEDWAINEIHEKSRVFAYFCSHDEGRSRSPICQTYLETEGENAEFVAESRTSLPKLARMLELALAEVDLLADRLHSLLPECGLYQGQARDTLMRHKDFRKEIEAIAEE